MPPTELSRPTLSIVYQAVDSLKPRSTNPRTHSKKQIGQIASAIRRFGFTNPVLVDDANGIVAGHGRVEAAKAVGLNQVPTVRLSAMSEAEIRAYVIADNRLAENAGWDRELLGLELQYLTDLDIDFDVTLTGFELPEIDLLIGELSLGRTKMTLQMRWLRSQLVRPSPARAISGSIGNHRLICGDSTRARDLSGGCSASSAPDGVHRPALQRADFRARRRPWRGPAPRICDGIGRDVAGRVHGIPADGIRPSRGVSPLTGRSIISAWTGAISRKYYRPVLPPIRS